MSIVLCNACDYKSYMAEFYEEYNKLLVQADPEIEACLAMQNYDEEIAQLEKKFAPPHNGIFIALCDSEAAGCVGFKYFAPGICELKRLYVRDKFRHYGIGKLLCEEMFDAARAAGYKKMYLDTLPGLESAVRLYRRLGFYEIEKYYPNPVNKAIYMCYDL